MTQPVFYDPRQARWKRLRRLFDILGVTVTLLIVFFAYTALRSESLPELLLPVEKRPYHALKEKEKEKAKEKRRSAARRGHRKSKGAPSQVPPRTHRRGRSVHDRHRRGGRHRPSGMQHL